MYRQENKERESYREIFIFVVQVSEPSKSSTHFSLEILAFETGINLESSGIPSYGSNSSSNSRPKDFEALCSCSHSVTLECNTVNDTRKETKCGSFQSSLRSESRFYSSFTSSIYYRSIGYL